MGRGTISGGGENGLYSLTLDVGKDLKTKALTAFDAELADVNALIAKLQADVSGLAAQRAELLATVDAAINALAAAMQANPKPSAAELQALTKAAQDAAAPVFRVNAELAMAQDGLNGAEAQKMQLLRDRGAMESVQAERTVSAWCVDYTTDAEGEVGTIEVPGEPQRVLIAPGGGAGLGKLMARALMSPEQAFYNAAILPGWQRWKPTYRVGTITALALEANTANVTLDAAVSTAQGLSVMRKDAPLALAGVPVQYMSCNALAFEVGDRVVVAFAGMSWDDPRVIGFVQNPRACFPRISISDDSVVIGGPASGINSLRGLYFYLEGSTKEWWDQEGLIVTINSTEAEKAYTSPIGFDVAPERFIAFKTGVLGLVSLGETDTYHELGFHRENDLTRCWFINPILTGSISTPQERLVSLRIEKDEFVFMDVDFVFTVAYIGGFFVWKVTVDNKIKDRMFRPNEYDGFYVEVS
jgi:hypothetical protein